MYSSDEHSTFELSWFLSHQEVIERILESCKRGKGVITAHPFTNKSTKIIIIMDIMQELRLSFSGYLVSWWYPVSRQASFLDQ